MTRVLGAVLAGGQSRRFGRDKAQAVLDGRTLIDRVLAALGPQLDRVVVCGRVMQGMECVADRPRPDLGPLGGLNAALHEGRRGGFDMVVSVPCDAAFLPGDLVARLLAVGGAGYAASLPVIGVWPVALADRLDAHLAAGGDRSMRRWVAAIGAGAVAVEGVGNINTVADLELLAGTFRG
jgi:molybdopterin-guanine dinucleotide biosynthesis protein A